MVDEQELYNLITLHVQYLNHHYMWDECLMTTIVLLIMKIKIKFICLIHIFLHFSILNTYLRAIMLDLEEFDFNILKIRWCRASRVFWMYYTPQENSKTAIISYLA